MNKKELVFALSEKSGCSKAEANRNVVALIEIIGSTMRRGEKITLAGFGIFEVRERAPRMGRNPRTGQALQIQAARIPLFRASAALKALLNRVK